MTPAGLSMLAGLLPAAGAVALVAGGLRRRARRGRPGRSDGPIHFPIEPPVAAPARPGGRSARSAPLPGTCRVCGTDTPPRESTCAMCARAVAANGGGVRQTLLHWAVFLAMMTAVIGGGYLVAP
jgi:predicted nucleic acid-binding Zn ribbon protein